MGVTYEICRSDVKKTVEHITTEHHGELFAAGVTIGCLYAFAEKDDAGQPKTVAVKLHGYPCAAVIRITPYKKRVQGIEDAEITIDGDWWAKATREEQEALIDHELTHLLVQYEEDGSVKTDDHRRPKLKMRLHDSQVGVFKEIIKRHGNASIDAQVSRQFADEYGQLLMDFAPVEFRVKPPPEMKASKGDTADDTKVAPELPKKFGVAELMALIPGRPSETEPLDGSTVTIDTVPLNQAMGKVKKRKRKAN